MRLSHPVWQQVPTDSNPRLTLTYTASCSESPVRIPPLIVSLIAQPPALFARWPTLQSALDDEYDDGAHAGRLLVHHDDDHPAPTPWAPHVGAGLAAAVVAGILAAASGVLLRVLSQEGGVHEGKFPPTMMLRYILPPHPTALLATSHCLLPRFPASPDSYLVAFMFVEFSALAAVARASGLASLPGWEWSSVAWPDTAVDWLLIGVHCVCVLTAQLATAGGIHTGAQTLD